MKYVRRVLQIFTIPSVALGLGACTSTEGRKISPDDFKAVRINSSHETELRKKFGDPSQVSAHAVTVSELRDPWFGKKCGRIGEGYTRIEYRYSEANRDKRGIETRNFLVNKEGVVCGKLTTMYLETREADRASN